MYITIIIIIIIVLFFFLHSFNSQQHQKKTSKSVQKKIIKIKIQNPRTIPIHQNHDPFPRISLSTTSDFEFSRFRVFRVFDFPAMAAQTTGRSSSSSRIVGDYVVGKQIGAGSFSVVWHARHKVHGTEVAIKEIATLRLNKKLQESLMSEIFILKRINHPNIISLHDIIQVQISILLGI